MTMTLTVELQFKPGDRVRIWKPGRWWGMVGEVHRVRVEGSVYNAEQTDLSTKCYNVKVDGEAVHRNFYESVLEAE